MAALTAIMLGLGGYNQGRQQRLQNQQNQEQIDQQGNYQNAQLSLEQQKAKQVQDQALRDRGIDPATNLPMQLPKNLQQIVPNNGGKPATDQQTIDHLYSVANALASQGNTVGANIALTRAQSLESIVKQGQQNANILGREEKMADYRTTLPLTPWQQYEQGLNQQYGPPGMRLSPYQQYEETNPSPYQQWEEGFREAHPPGGSSTKIVTQKKGDFDTFWKNATTVPETTNRAGMKVPPLDPKTGQPVTSAITAQDQQDLQREFLEMDESGDPIAYAKKLLKTIPKAPAAIKRAIQLRASWRQSELQAEKSGGSPDTGNPTNGGQRLPQRSIWQMLIQNGATPDEATKLTAIAYAESGGDPTSVNPTDNNGKQTSWGLFQISDGTHNEPQGWQDPEVNTQMAIAKLRSKQGLHAWGSYNSGAYQQYMPNAGVANR